MKIVAFDCSTARGTVAAVAAGETVFRDEFDSPRGRGGQFFPVLAAALRAVGGRPDRVAVGIGPGSYNGLRTTVAAAAGLRMTTGAELVGVESVRCLAVAASEYLAVGDARGGQVFVARVRDRRLVGGIELVPAESLAEWLAGGLPVRAVGSLGDHVIARPDAGILAEIAVGEVAGSEVAPYYLKAPHVTTPKNPPKSGVVSAKLNPGSEVGS